MTNTLTIDLPIHVNLEEAKFMIFASLFGKGAISSGKAASYLGMKRIDFLERVGEYGISIFSDEEGDLARILNMEL
jgi:predicted HTH domain antitoxin